VYCSFHDLQNYLAEDLKCSYNELCFQGESICEYYCG
jgi:hypothetical protein